jgi:endonuclease I
MRKAKLIVALLLFCIVALKAQIPSGYYDGTQGLYGDDLKTSLHNIIDDHIEFSYNDLRDFILINTDEDPNNSNNVILLYTGRSQAKNTFGGGANDWNREHVWAKSHGGFGNNPPAGTDAHHIRPTDASVNSSRGNLDFDMGGSPVPEATG